jgi:hypothetical protein
VEDRLAELAFELLQFTVLDRMDMSERFKQSPDDLSARLVYHCEDVSKLAVSILDELGPKSPLRTIRDIITVVAEEGLLLMDADESWDALTWGPRLA